MLAESLRHDLGDLSGGDNIEVAICIDGDFLYEIHGGKMRDGRYVLFLGKTIEVDGEPIGHRDIKPENRLEKRHGVDGQRRGQPRAVDGEDVYDHVVKRPVEVAVEDEDDRIKVGAAVLDPESPVRLRECLTALARHDDTHVLRFEVGLGASTRGVDEPAFSMTLTHSMGVEHEKVVIPLLAKVFATAMADFAEKARPAKP